VRRESVCQRWRIRTRRYRVDSQQNCLPLHPSSLPLSFFPLQHFQPRSAPSHATHTAKQTTPTDRFTSNPSQFSLRGKFVSFTQVFFFVRPTFLRRYVNNHTNKVNIFTQLHISLSCFIISFYFTTINTSFCNY
jgi:hypothetical protein